MSEPFIGEIRIWACNFAPRNWAFCNGQLLPIAQNTALFSLLGTTYGGDGRTTFGLPNLQDRIPMHPGHGPGLTSRRLGDTGGTVAVTLSEAQMPAHAHSFQASPDPGEVASPAGAALARSVGGAVYASANNLVPLGSQLSSVGGGAAHNNLQPYLALNICIALVGLYPSRS